MKKRIVILGGGESGTGAAILAQAKGFDTFVSDFSVIPAKYKEMLNAHQIPWEEGKHTEELVLNADEIIKSPGINVQQLLTHISAVSGCDAASPTKPAISSTIPSPCVAIAMESDSDNA